MYLVSNTNEKLFVDDDFKNYSSFIEEFIDEYNEDIYLFEFTTQQIQNVIEFYTYFSKNPYKDISKPVNSNDFSKVIKDEWYVEFLKNKDLFELIKIANYLGMKSLLEFIFIKFACMTNDKSPEQIASILNIKHTFTKNDFDRIEKLNELVKLSESNT